MYLAAYGEYYNVIKYLVIVVYKFKIPRSHFNNNHNIMTLEIVICLLCALSGAQLYYCAIVAQGVLAQCHYFSISFLYSCSAVIAVIFQS